MNAMPKNKEVRIKWNKNKKNNLQNTAKKTEQLLLPNRNCWPDKSLSACLLYFRSKYLSTQLISKYA